jgi:surfactin synthase thioesterase subunit
VSRAWQQASGKPLDRPDGHVLHRYRSQPGARVRLLCVPYAGGAPPVFRSWAELLPVGVDLWAVQAPGRARRISEPPFEHIELIVDEVLTAVAPDLDVPMVVFGHSMGALVAFELARALRRRELPEPARLFLSGHQAPHLPPVEPPTHGLPDEAFLERLRKLDGTPEEALQHPELMAVFLPLLRADFAAVEAYEYRDEPPLSCGITAFGGRGDRLVREEQLEAWRMHTIGPFAVHLLSGGHFFLHHSAPSLLAVVVRDLEQLLPS